MNLNSCTWPKVLDKSDGKVFDESEGDVGEGEYQERGKQVLDDVQKKV